MLSSALDALVQPFLDAVQLPAPPTGAAGSYKFALMKLPSALCELSPLLPISPTPVPVVLSSLGRMWGSTSQHRAPQRPRAPPAQSPDPEGQEARNGPGPRASPTTLAMRPPPNLFGVLCPCSCSSILGLDALNSEVGLAQSDCSWRGLKGGEV